MTMRHLASGDRYASMKFDFRVPHNTMSVCVREVCQALIDELKDECIQCPTTEAEWRVIYEALGRSWNMHHAVGAPWARSRSPTGTLRERNSTPWGLRRNAIIAVGTP